ncbi:MAG: glycosyltransferase, partial [Thermodesulfovibrionia bacterium]|nr:glycosyltransferase [Thermodesulfovibrionia bacterium]
RHNVPATFFFLGLNVLQHRWVVKEVYEAGFDIGNHTFTHSPNVHSSERRLKWELNATNKLIEDITGRSTALYRPPMLLDIGSDPTIDPDAPELPLMWAANNGYFVVGVDIDPKDWSANSPDEVIANLKETIADGHIILFHDGGEDVRHVVEALETIIKELKSQGYEFVTISNLFGLTTDVMPVAPQTAHIYQDGLQSMYIAMISYIGPSMSVLVYVILILIIFRFLFIFTLRFIFTESNNITMQRKSGGRRRKVSVLIPAYNESENIASTILSVIKNSYQPKEIIVIDDGSTDGTAEKVEAVQKEYPELIHLIRVKNGGKTKALNLGFKIAKSSIVVTLDGDTVITENTIGNLVRHFRDREVGAVAGKICAVSQSSVLGALQSIEYIIGQNIEKRAFSVLNAVGVVPGAVGAWRKSFVWACGRFSNDTLVEDQDLTLSILQLGKKVIYDPEAIAYTEIPQTVKDLIKQRFRWVFGTLQCFWKYKSSLFSNSRPALGWIVLPNIALYGTVVPLFSPLMDTILILSLLFGVWKEVLLAYILYTFFDMLYATIALWNEKGNRKLLWAIPLQRICYRQIMYYVVIKSIIKAVEGTSVLWNKVRKPGNVQKYFFNTIQDSK